MTFKVITLLLVSIYGVLLIFAAFMGLRGRDTSVWSNIAMIMGSILMIFGPFMDLYKNTSMIYILILGLMLIHIAAINYDYRIFNTISIRDNILRMCISSIILITYYIGYIM